MPDTKNITQRHDAAMERIAKALNVPLRNLQGEARGDPQLARTITLENIAGAAENLGRSKSTGDLRQAILAANDAALNEMPGVGEKSLVQLREWAKDAPQTEEQSLVTVETVKEVGVP